MEHRKPALLLPIAFLPPEGCNFSFSPFFVNIKKGFALFFLAGEAFARRHEVF
jgi:hypothetical protein